MHNGLAVKIAPPGRERTGGRGHGAGGGQRPDEAHAIAHGGPVVLESGHRELGHGIGDPGGTEEENAETAEPDTAVGDIDVALQRREDHLLREEPKRCIADAADRPGLRGDPEPGWRDIRVVRVEREDAESDYGHPGRRGPPRVRCRAEEQQFIGDDVDVMFGDGLLDRLQLSRERWQEDVPDVERELSRPLEPHPLRMIEVEAIVVEIGSGRERDELGTRLTNGVGELGSGEEVDPVTESGEPPRELQKRRDVGVHGRAGEKDFPGVCHGEHPSFVGSDRTLHPHVILVNMADQTKRRYQSVVREEKAAATRRRVLDTAAACFTERGYEGTSLARIAERAGVSIDTVQATGAKSEILLGAFERAFVGVETSTALSGGTPFEELLAIEDPREMLRAIIHASVTAVAGTRALWWAFRGAAASDPVVHETFQGLIARRHADNVAVLQLAQLRGAPIDDVERTATRGELSLTQETYTHFVDDNGWSEEDYLAWVEAQMELIVFGGSPSAS